MNWLTAQFPPPQRFLRLVCLLDQAQHDHLGAAMDPLRAEGVSIAPKQLAHILPTISEHINRLGRDEFDAEATGVQTDIAMLPLRPVVEMAEQPGLGT